MQCSRPRFLAAIALVALSYAACMPYVVPPATGAVGVTTHGKRGARAGVHAELGLSPAQLAPSLFQRSWDASLVATFERVGAINDNVWGATLLAGPVLHPWGYRDDNRSNRVVPSLLGSWTSAGYGAGVRVAIERAAFSSTTVTTPGSGASTHGEGALGFYVEAGYRWHDDDRVWNATAGVTVRIPAAAGIACCIR